MDEVREARTLSHASETSLSKGIVLESSMVHTATVGELPQHRQSPEDVRDSMVVQDPPDSLALGCKRRPCRRGASSSITSVHRSEHEDRIWVLGSATSRSIDITPVQRLPLALSLSLPASFRSCPAGLRLAHTHTHTLTESSL
eukprot:273347-Amphidinium_carterae.1